MLTTEGGAFLGAVPVVVPPCWAELCAPQGQTKRICRSGCDARAACLYGTSVGTTLMLLNGDPLISFVLITV
jgi:hypothetical protein